MKQAADEDFVDAASILGMAYATGKAGIRRNGRLARELPTRAAAAGDDQAERMLDAIEKWQGTFGKSR